MKQFLLLSALLCCTYMLSAQSISRKVLSSLGGTYQDSNFQASYTVGETFISTLSNGSIQATQGFQQPPCFDDSSSFSATVVDMYTWNGNSYTLSGTYTHTLINSGGCDSIVTLHLIVYHTTVTMTLQNVVQVSPSVFEYDVMLTNTGNTTLALKGYSCGINHATGMRGTGSITHAYVSRAPSLSTIPLPAPGYTPSNNHLRFIAANASSGNEVNILPNVPIRIATMRVTNSIPFPADFVPDFTLQTLTAIGKTQCIATCIVTPPGTTYNINGTGNTSAAGTMQGLTGIVNTPCLFLHQTSNILSSVTQTIPVTCYGQNNGMAQISLSGNGSANPVGNYTVDGGIGIPYSINPFVVSNLSAGTHTITVNTNYGCSSTNLVNITQPSIISTNSSLTTCDSYIWDGTTYTSSGTPTHTYISSSGCDSLHTLNLTITHSNSGASSLTVCNIYNWNGTTYSISGGYTQTFTNIEGCDSMHTLTLTVNQGATSLTSIGSCGSYNWNGTTYTNSGTYFQSFTNTVGCDSVASLNLTINNIHIQQSDTTICAGASITLNAISTSSTANNLPTNLQNGLVVWYPFNGNANDESGNGNHGVVIGPSLTSDRFGNPNSAYQFNGNDNNSTSYIVANHNNLPAGNSPRTISVWLTHDTYGVPGGNGNDGHPIISYGTPSTNSDNELMFYTNSSGLPFARYAGFNNDLNTPFTYVTQTWYNMVATFDGITASLYLNNALLSSGNYSSWNTILDSVLIGTQTARTRFHNGKIDDILIYNRVLSLSEINQLYTQGTTMYLWSTGDTTSTINLTPTQTTTYYLTTNNGSSSCIDSITVSVNNPSVNAGANLSVCQGDSVTLIATGSSTYQWNNSVINGQAFVPSNTQTYTVIGTNSLGCTATSQVTATVNPKPIPYINPTGSTSFCDGNSVILLANSGNSLMYKWYKDGTEILGATSSSYQVTQSGNYLVEETNSNNCVAVSTSQAVTVNSCDVNLHLKLFYQGYYAGASEMPPVLLNQGVSNDSSVTDTILIELHSPLPPYGLVLSKQAILHTNGNAVCTFNYVNGNYYLADSYYVAIRHRNGLTTWSSNPIAFTLTSVNYDFTSSSSKAYGDNMTEVEPGIWAFYTGELNYDENIDLLDNPLLESDINNFQYGYFATDLNGDGNCDLLDVPTLETNIFNFVFSYQPSWTGTLPTVTTSTVSSIVGGSAVCGGNVTSDGGSNILARGVCWSVNPRPTINDTKSLDGTNVGSFTSNLTSLNPNTTYYVRAYVTSEVGTVYGNELSFITANTVLTIGQIYQGGIIAYILQSGDPGYISGEQHGFIAAPNDQSNGITWWNGLYISTGAFALSLGGGNINTNAIVAAQGQGFYAAKICFDLILNGYSDWYLPSRDELDKLILNQAIIGGFSNQFYWTSSETASNAAWIQYPVNGAQVPNWKDYTYSVRAIRSF